MPDRTLRVALRQAGPVPLDVAFRCGSGDVLGIFGPSGSGKTTILRCIAGLHTIGDGLIQAGSETWLDTSQRLALPTHRRRVGFVVQEYALFPHLNVLGNVMAALGHRPRAERRAHAHRFLEMVHLTGLGLRYPAALSGGERQRVALARALAREPDVLLLDEPFAAVDRSVRRRLQDQIDELRRTLEIPLLLVTHDFDDVVRLATHLLVLEQGRAAALGSLEEVTSRPDVDVLREVVGLGSSFEADITRVDPHRGLTELAFSGGTLFVAVRSLAPGARVRVRIPARDVVLALEQPRGVSLHNVLEAAVAAIHVHPDSDHVTVQLDLGGVLLLAEVTRDAVTRLALAVGMRLYALVKSVSIEVRGSDHARVPAVSA
ncbi:MAG: molybdenum ABC transporter ATP-binding protein [Vicinamibacterales bacterium]